MIIPVRCMNCGKLLADKWLEYTRRLKEIQGDNYGNRTYFDGTESLEKTPEAQAMEEFEFLRYCCRKVFLTHVDLIRNI